MPLNHPRKRLALRIYPLLNCILPGSRSGTSNSTCRVHASLSFYICFVGFVFAIKGTQVNSFTVHSYLCMPFLLLLTPLNSKQSASIVCMCAALVLKIARVIYRSKVLNSVILFIAIYMVDKKPWRYRSMEMGVYKAIKPHFFSVYSNAQVAVFVDRSNIFLNNAGSENSVNSPSYRVNDNCTFLVSHRT